MGISRVSLPVGRMKQLQNSLSQEEWRRTGWMFSSVVALHVLGFGIFIAFVVPGHYRGLGIGVSVLAYTLGLRHAFDADHISAIDNTTRKLLHEGKRPLSVGFFFSLGHSSVVFLLAVLLNFGIRCLDEPVKNSSCNLQ